MVCSVSHVCLLWKKADWCFFPMKDGYAQIYGLIVVEMSCGYQRLMNTDLSSSSSSCCSVLSLSLTHIHSSSITKHHAAYVPLSIIHSHLILHWVKNVVVTVAAGCFHAVKSVTAVGNVNHWATFTYELLVTSVAQLWYHYCFVFEGVCFITYTPLKISLNVT